MLDLYAQHHGAAPAREETALRLTRRARRGSDPAGASPDRRRGRRAAPRPGDVGDRPVHVPAGTDRTGRGRGAARSAPHDGPSPASVAPARVRARAPPVDRGHLHVPRGRARQRQGRAVVRAGRGPRPHRRPRRTGSRRRAAGARTRPGVGAGGDPRLPGSTAAAPASDVEPRRAARVAGDRTGSRRDPRARRAHGAQDGRTRARAGRDTGTPPREGRVVRDRVLRFYVPTGHDVAVEVEDPPTEPLQPLDEATRRISSARRRGILHPAEIVQAARPAQLDRRPAGGRVHRTRTDRQRPARAGHAGHRRRTRAASSSARFATSPSATPRGCCA